MTQSVTAGIPTQSVGTILQGLPEAGHTWVLTGSLELMSRDVAKTSELGLRVLDKEAFVAFLAKHNITV